MHWQVSLFDRPATLSTGNQRNRGIDLTWRLQSVQLQAGVYGTSAQQTRWADASGSLVWMDGQTFAANRIDDAFVVVTPGSGMMRWLPKVCGDRVMPSRDRKSVV